MIYDKNQFKFNIAFLLVLFISLSLTIYLSARINSLNNKYQSINGTVESLNDNLNYNQIQAPKNDIDFILTTTGLTISNANDYGVLSGPSMQPTIFDGNTIIQQKYFEGMELKLGDIIRYTNNQGEGIIHRIRGIYASTIYVQGDSLNTGEKVPKSRITHKIICVLYT
ncbi:S24/S26 family peptidase [archaeon]|nr:S24/S26 family peptidase [archaeon]MBT4648275.1 S24/S26 family peptidase [archaeon]MBT6821527.1 S24/S26 family peptidase [archaeon]MBT7391926.1 S24/S26 family peptidase [archaeon]